MIDSPADFTDAGQRFHLAVIEASGNRALIAQFRALRHVVWPQNAQRAKREIAENAQKIHHQLYTYIEAQDGEAARKLMIDHLVSIRAVSFSGTAEGAESGMICC